MRKQIRKVIALTSVGVMTMAMLCMGTPAQAAKKAKEKAAEVDLDGTYHAAMGIQTCNEIWIQRWGYYDDSQNEMYGTENENKLYSKDSTTDELTTYDGEFTDVEIAGNGTYTVSLDGANFSGETTISQLHIATDIPLNDQIKFSNVTVNVDGRDVVTMDEGFMEEEANYLTGGMVCLAFNHWRAELVSMLQDDKGLIETDSGYKFLTGAGDESVSLTFTVSGFNYDNTSEAEAATSEQATDSANSVSTEATQTKSNSNTTVVIVVIVAVVVVAGVVVVMATKKKKK